MKARIMFLVLVFTLSLEGNTQNFVPNYSFEQYDTCPQFNAQLYYCLSWQAIGSVEYYNRCAPGNNVSVPSNYNGYQEARTGNGYCGLLTYYTSSNGREFIRAQLLQQLKPGTAYCGKFFVSLADTARLAADKIGAYFSATAVNPVIMTYPYLINYPAQINNTNGMLLNSSGWTEISGIFTAAGNERYITIGNFEFDTTTNTQTVHSGPPYQIGAYYYIEDVSVEEVIPVKAGRDTGICKNDSVRIGINLTQAATYSWWPAAGLSSSTAANPKASPSVTTVYHVRKNQCNTITTDSVTITLKDCDSANIFVPTAFSPNGDGANDVLFVRSNKTVDALDFAVYDRWGELVFHTNDITRGWDGTYKDKNLSNGIFMYYVKATIKGKEFFQKGDIALIR